jgi:betaine-aldehyde dehydrogenase
VSDRVFRNFINGESRDSADGQMMDLVNPTTGEVYAQAANSTAEDVDQAFQAAATAFESWRDATPGERSLA